MNILVNQPSVHRGRVSRERVCCCLRGHVTHENNIRHMGHMKHYRCFGFFFLLNVLDIGTTIRTHRGVQCILYEGFSLNWSQDRFSLLSAMSVFVFVPKVVIVNYGQMVRVLVFFSSFNRRYYYGSNNFKS